MKKKSRFPLGWDEKRVRKVMDHYENQTDEEAVAEDEAALADCTLIAVPKNLVSEVCALLDREAKKGGKSGRATVAKSKRTPSRG